MRASILSFCSVFFFCRLASTCYVPFLNRKLNVVIRNKLLAHLLIMRPMRGVQEEIQRRIGLLA